MSLHRKEITSIYITAITQTITLFIVAPLGDVLLGREHETFNDNFQEVAIFLHILFVWFLEFAQYWSISLLICSALNPFRHGRVMALTLVVFCKTL